jgi:hypothetical protein
VLVRDLDVVKELKSRVWWQLSTKIMNARDQIIFNVLNGLFSLHMVSAHERDPATLSNHKQSQIIACVAMLPNNRPLEAIIEGIRFQSAVRHPRRRTLQAEFFPNR